MKAIIHSEKSGIAGMNCRDLQEMNPEKGEIKIRLKTAGLNRRDLFVMNNRDKGDKPFIPGSDGAGIIEEVGEDVKGLKNGTFAECVIVEEDNVVQKPPYLSWKQAGVLSLSALTAYRALFTKGQLKR